VVVVEDGAVDVSATIVVDSTSSAVALGDSSTCFDAGGAHVHGAVEVHDRVIVSAQWHYSSPTS
jgi:hypothetical protein